jgi:uncharacterized protein (DUF2062 family)
VNAAAIMFVLIGGGFASSVIGVLIYDVDRLFSAWSRFRRRRRLATRISLGE